MKNQCVHDEDVSRRVEGSHDGLDQSHGEIHNRPTSGFRPARRKKDTVARLDETQAEYAALSRGLRKKVCLDFLCGDYCFRCDRSIASDGYGRRGESKREKRYGID